VLQAQIHLAFDDYLKETPYYSVSSTSWQCYAARKLRNLMIVHTVPDAGLMPNLEPQFVAYEKFLQGMQSRATNLAAAIAQSVSHTQTVEVIKCVNDRLQVLLAARMAVAAADAMMIVNSVLPTLFLSSACAISH
jgi:hypothetical protein